MFSKRSILTGFLCWGVQAIVVAQGPSQTTDPKPFTKVQVPPGPNAASLGKFGDIPVNHYTGLPKVDIPLYTIQAGSVSVPISLSYHASIKVNDLASWVGLGWSLNAGGAVMRTLRGLADDDPNVGYWAQVANWNNTSGPSYQFKESAANGRVDSEPDAYYYNILGKAGECAFQNATTAFPLTDRQIQIQRDAEGYRIVDAEGVQYLLGQQYTSQEQTTSVTETIGDDNQQRREYVSAYFVDKIISANRADTVYFTYAHERVSYGEGIAQTLLYDKCTNTKTPSSTATTVDIYQARLSSIRWRSGRVDFAISSTPDRNDLAGGHKLNSFTVYNRVGQQLKQYVFGYDYFRSQPNPAPTYAELWRLKLASVQEVSGQQVIPAHKFQYFEHRRIPTRNSTAQDEWGFANLNTSTSLIPNQLIGTDGRYYFVPDGGSRTPNAEAARAGLLCRITYPTGGTTRFYYEPHVAGKIANRPTTTLRRTDYSLTLPTTSNYSGEQTAPFTVTRPAYVELSGNCSVITNYGEGSISIGFRGLASSVCTGQNQTTSILTGSSSSVRFPSNHRINLPAGTYTLFITSSEPAASSVSATVTARVYEQEDSSVEPGGLRIRAVTSRPSRVQSDSLTQRYYYTVGRNTTASSGVLVSQPLYNYDYTTLSCAVATYLRPTNYRGFVSHAKAGLGATQGSHIGYKEVTVETGSGVESSGYTQYFFTAADQYPDTKRYSIPFPPAESMDYKRGLLVKKIEYNSDELPVSRETNRYKFDTRQELTIYGMAVGASRQAGLTGCSSTDTQYSTPIYRVRSQWGYLQASTITRFSPGTDTTQQLRMTTQYCYDNPAHGLLSKTRTHLPNGDVATTCLTYPPDVTLSSGDIALMSEALRRMQAQHIHADVVERSEWLTKVGQTDSLLTGSTLNLYSPAPHNAAAVYPSITLALRLPIPGTSLGALSSSGAGFTYDARYQEKTSYQLFDGAGNLRQQQQVRERGLVTSYLWGYHRRQLLAQVQNASVDRVAFTSFEPTSMGQFGYDSLASSSHLVSGGRTGQRCYRLDSYWGVSRGNLPVGDYELLFWATGQPALYHNGSFASPLRQEVVATAPGGWQQYRIRLRCTSTSSLNIDAFSPGQPILLDEVRLCPVGAQMTTYTHDPLAGITSQTDPSGRTTTYEYDALGRLLRRRDEQGRILAEQEYHYARP